MPENMLLQWNLLYTVGNIQAFIARYCTENSIWVYSDR